MRIKKVLPTHVFHRRQETQPPLNLGDVPTAVVLSSYYFAIMHIFYVLRANLSFFIEKKQRIISHETPKIAFVAEFNLFLNGKFKFQATFGQIAHSDGTSMQKDGILDDGET